MRIFSTPFLTSGNADGLQMYQSACWLTELSSRSQIGITLDTYSHVVPTLQLEAAGRLDRLMRSPVKTSKRAKARRRA